MTYQPGNPNLKVFRVNGVLGFTADILAPDIETLRHAIRYYDLSDWESLGTQTEIRVETEDLLERPVWHATRELDPSMVARRCPKPLLVGAISADNPEDIDLVSDVLEGDPQEHLQALIQQATDRVTAKLAGTK